MQSSKILWGQVTIVLLIVLGAVWGATQWTAQALGFQPELGPPMFLVAGYPIYPPPAFFWWWFSYDAYAPQIFVEGAYIAASGGIAAVVVAVAMSVWRARERKHAETYGSARWATHQEVERAGLLGDDGVVLGRLADAYLRHDGPEHILCFAPTRSGKGVGLVIPSLLTWAGSAIVHDIKGENWTLTAGFRARIGRVLLFDPTNTASAGYNPLLEVRKGEWEVRDVQNVADVLVDPEGSLERRNHWEKTSHALLVGAILHVLYAEPDKTLAGVAAFLSDPRRPIEATLAAMMSTRHLGEAGVHPVVASAARELLNKSENERSGVLSTAMSFLGLYRDPVVAQVTSRSEWRIADLVEGDRPATLYLVVPPSDISRTKPLIRLLLNQIGRRLTEELKPSAKRHKVLLMLDEFPALGRLDFFESALAFMAGYGLKAFLIAQSLNQIEKAYGPNNAILDNCHVRVSFATNDERTAKRISDALGTATEMRAMKNYAGHRLSPWLGHLMVSRTETARALLTPGEVMQLPPGDEIVMAAGVHPIRALKVRYFTDQRLLVRVIDPPAPVPAGSAPANDWSMMPIPKVLPPAAAHTEGDADPANGGIRREPELPVEQEIVAPPAPPPGEFEFDDNASEEATTARRLFDAQVAEIDREGRSGYLYDDRFWSVAYARPTPRLPLATEINALDLASGKSRIVTSDDAAAMKGEAAARFPEDAGATAISPTGGRAWVASEHADMPRGPTLLRVEVGGKKIVCSGEACREPIAGLWWTGQDTLFILRGGNADNGGRTALYRWRPGVEPGPRRLFETEDFLPGCGLAAAALICARETATGPRVLVRFDPATGRNAVVFDPNPEFAQVQLGKVERLTWTDRDGVRTYGDLTLPPDHRAGERHPLIIVQYISRGFQRGGQGDEYPIQLLAARGYAVLNFQWPAEAPEAAAKASDDAAQRVKVRNWSGRRRIFTALDAGIDTAIAKGVVNPELVGITGLSDGASTVQFALNNSTRFKAAIISTCCDDPNVVFNAGPGYGNTVVNGVGYPPAGADGREFWRAQSLAVNAVHLRVPLLMNLPDGEFRIAQEAFAALKAHNAPVEMYVYPDEWHTKNHPAHRLAIYGRNIAWFDFWLLGLESDDPSRAAEIARWRALRAASAK